MKNSVIHYSGKYNLTVGLVFILVGCYATGHDDLDDMPHYRIVSTANSDPIILAPIALSPHGLLALDSASFYSPGTVAWKLLSSSNPTNVLSGRISSLFRVMAGSTYLEILPDGTTQNLTLVSSTERTDAGIWIFERVDSGFCHIKNESLGSELALTAITDEAPPYPVQMAAIDPAQTQEWKVVGVGKPGFGFDALCNGIPDSS